MENDTVVDRAGWKSGPWDNEPDRVEFKSHGLPCLIVRQSSGFLCGYVAVPPDHQYHGKDYDDVPADVHGGLTYADSCSGGICHVPEKGEPDNVWWFGFDCAHAGDDYPGHGFSGGFGAASLALFGGGSLAERGYGASYKTAYYVKAECEKLAAWLSA